MNVYVFDVRHQKAIPTNISSWKCEERDWNRFFRPKQNFNNIPIFVLKWKDKKKLFMRTHINKNTKLSFNNACIKNISLYHTSMYIILSISYISMYKFETKKYVPSPLERHPKQVFKWRLYLNILYPGMKVAVCNCEKNFFVYI